MTAISVHGEGFTISHKGRALLKHTPGMPCVYVGVGQESMDMYRGNFDIADEILERIPLRRFEATGDGMRLLSPDGEHSLLLTATEEAGRLYLRGEYDDKSCNRIWLRLPAVHGEAVYGGGEQFSHFNLRDRRFPVWTSEQGVGRNKKTEITFLSDAYDRAGGDYWWTFFPQCTFLSTQRYFCHAEDTSYAVMDFTHTNYHELHLWQRRFSFALDTADTLPGVVERLTELLGRQKPLPEWAVKGIWLGIQGGPEAVDRKLSVMRDGGATISAVWCQDWAGTRMTSFGKRLFWNWRWNSNVYPDLPAHIARWHSQGVKFLAYIAPHLCSDGDIFREAADNGYFVKNREGGVHLIDFGEFSCGTVDFTNPEAFVWYKELIKTNLIGLGADGWMADFSEYFPIDCVVYDGSDPMLLHNRWPALWARLNHEAVQEAGREGEIVYFMRAGGIGSQRDCPLMWAGDQNVDFSLDDGLASVIPAALSLGMTGHGLHTSDIGGYTTLFHLKRSKELLLRWAEFCAFTPVMRTHEGNRPDRNVQFDEDDETISFFAWGTAVHAALTPYLEQVMQTCAKTGMPVMRPTILMYEDDPAAQDLQYQYFLGDDLLVAPVYEESAQSVGVYVPEEGFCDLWTDEPARRGYAVYDAPLGSPLVLYRKGSAFEPIFARLKPYEKGQKTA